LKKQILEGVCERLTAQGRHIRNGVKVVGLILIPDSPSDVADLKQELMRDQFPLQREVDLIGDVGPELWIKRGPAAR